MTDRTRYPPAPALIALSAVAVVAIAAAVSVVGSPPATASSGRTVAVTRGVVQSTVSGAGNLAPANQLELNFGSSGKVTKIYVEPGEHVSQGELLARVDDSSANVAVAQAKAALATAEDTQASAAPGTTAATSAAAAVDSAELTLKSAEQSLTDTELRAPAPATVAAIAGSVGETVSATSTSTSGSASSSSATPSTGAASSSAAGSTSTSTTTSSSGFITLAQLHLLKMDVSVSEADVGKVKVGQPATVTVDAVSGLKLSGHVSAIGLLSSASSSTSSSSSTAVSYPVTIALDQGSTDARAGMSASADIVVAQVSGLTVPTQAVTRSTVTLIQNGKQVTTSVQTGVVGDSTTQIVSGVKAGDQVYVQSPSAAAGAAATGSSAASTQQRTGLGGGGGGLGGGRRRLRRRRCPAWRRRRGRGPGMSAHRPVIDVCDVSKTYQVAADIVVRALDHVSLRIERGESVAIMGSSGSGKSTLMHILGCLDAPTSGTYRLDGQVVGDIPEDELADLRNRRIGFVFQSFNLIPRTTALANVELPLAYAGVPRPRRRQAALDALDAVGMADRVGHVPSELSGGQQQRVAVARALVTNPSLILADEPTGNLDSRSTDEVLAVFERLNGEGRTVVLITHEEDVAERARRVIRLGDGHIVEDRLVAGAAA